MEEHDLPAHVEETVESISTLHAQHEREISHSQRFTNRVVKRMSSGVAIIWLTIAIGVWVLFNLIAGRFGYAFDHPPFSALQTLLAATGLYVTLMILRTQRHDDEVARRRERLTLELAIVSDRKIAKIIALLEELRREAPFLTNRRDAEAREMSAPVDTRAVLKAMRENDERTSDRPL